MESMRELLILSIRIPAEAKRTTNVFRIELVIIRVSVKIG
jgi:hypothetical protein